MPARNPLPLGPFNRLVVLENGIKRHDGYYCSIQCYCGRTFTAKEAAIRFGSVKSCGCLLKEHLSSGKARRSHGMADSPTYRVWTSMFTRCTNQKSRAFHNYGGRGITVCERWAKFENFLEDMGDRPGAGYSIDRIDNDGNYEPGNCRWATAIEQAANTRTAKIVILDGSLMSFSSAARAVNVSPATAHEYMRANKATHQTAIDHYASMRGVARRRNGRFVQNP